MIMDICPDICPDINKKVDINRTYVHIYQKIKFMYTNKSKKLLKRNINKINIMKISGAEYQLQNQNQGISKKFEKFELFCKKFVISNKNIGNFFDFCSKI